MERRYEVHMEGQLLVLADRPPGTWRTERTQVVRIGSQGDLISALDRMKGSDSTEELWLYSDRLPSLWDLFKNRYKFVHAAGGAVQDENGKLLVIKRLGKWDLPKGKLEKEESVEAAALREVEEECGIGGLKIMGPLAVTWHTYQRNGKDHLKRTDWFLMNGSSGKKLTPQTEEDIDEVRWMARDEVSRMKRETYPSLVNVLEAWEASNL